MIDITGERWNGARRAALSAITLTASERGSRL
jgi:hypothetical protein